MERWVRQFTKIRHHACTDLYTHMCLFICFILWILSLNKPELVKCPLPVSFTSRVEILTENPEDMTSTYSPGAVTADILRGPLWQGPDIYLLFTITIYFIYYSSVGDTSATGCPSLFVLFCCYHSWFCSLTLFLFQPLCPLIQLCVLFLLLMLLSLFHQSHTHLPHFSYLTVGKSSHHFVFPLLTSLVQPPLSLLCKI